MKAKKKTKRTRNKSNRTDQPHNPKGVRKDAVNLKVDSWLKADLIAIGNHMQPQCTLTQVVVQAMKNYRNENEHLISE